MMKPMLHVRGQGQSQGRSPVRILPPFTQVSPHRQRRPSVHVSHTHQPLVEALRCYYRRLSSSPRLALLVTSLSSFSLMR